MIKLSVLTNTPAASVWAFSTDIMMTDGEKTKQETTSFKTLQCLIPIPIITYTAADCIFFINL